MKLKKLLMGSAVAASYLFAIDPVTNLAISAPHNGGSTYNSAITFTWTAPSSVNSYLYVIDTNSTTIPSLLDTNQTSTINSSSATSLSELPSTNGDYYLHIQAVDSSNVKSDTVHSSASVDIDVQAGTVTMSPLKSTTALAPEGEIDPERT